MAARVPVRARGRGVAPGAGIGRLSRMGVLVLSWMWCSSFAAAQPPVWTRAEAGPRVSMMEIPLSIDLGPLFRRAEALLPRELGHWKGWRGLHGVETRYRAWRGPLSMFLHGDLLRVEAHVRYWVQARGRIIKGFGLEVGCGVDEPPRQAVVGLLVKLDLGPDWTLRPRFRVLPTRFLDGCEVTAADIDVSPLIDRLFRKRMEESLRSALADLGPGLEAARRRVAGYWGQLQQPVELTPGLWLRADPLALALASPRGQGDQLHTNLGIVLLLALGSKPPVPATQRPLPPLQTFIPRGFGTRFELNLDLDLDAVGRHLSGLLTSKPLIVEGHRVGIGRVDVAGDGRDLVLSALLTGEATGSIEIRAVPVFDPQQQAIYLRELDFVFEPQDPDQALMVDLHYQSIQTALQDGANELLGARTEGMREALESALSRSLPQGLKLGLASLQLASLDLRVIGSELRLTGTATGSLAVTPR